MAAKAIGRKHEILISFDDLAHDPSIFLYGVDFRNQVARFFRIDAGLPNDHCRKVIQQRPLLVPLNTLLDRTEALAAPTVTPIHFIWMTDFCGSTLYAKALNEVPGLYLYNETALFSDIANARRLVDHGFLPMTVEQWRSMLRMALYFQRKTFTAGDVALVKEWPASNYILHEVLGTGEAFRGIFLYASLDEYLASCLKDEYRRRLARVRVTKMFMEIGSMNALKGVDRTDLTDAQAAALHWLYLMYWHHEQGYGDHAKLRTLFNKDFFANPGDALQRSARHFGLALSDEDAQEITRGPVFSRHSKDPSRDFSTQAHQASLTTARDRFEKEVAAGLEWARAIMGRHPLPEHPGRSLLS